MLAAKSSVFVENTIGHDPIPCHIRDKCGTYSEMYSWCCAYDCAVQFITFTVISVRNTAVANAHFSEAWVFILCVIGFDGKTTACIAVDCGFDLRMTQDST